MGKKVIKIDGCSLSHLRSANDILLISTDVSKLEELSQQLHNRVGLEINLKQRRMNKEDA